MRHVKGKKWLAILSLVVLLVATPLLAACGGDDDDDDTPKVTPTTTPAQPTASPSPTATAKPAETPTPTKTSTPTPAGVLLTIDSKLKELMDDPGAKAILEKYLPAQIMNSPNLMALGANLTIPQIAPASGGLITDEMLKAISAELTKAAIRSATAAPSPTQTPQATGKLTGKPIKIGMITAWSGPAGMSGLLCRDVADVVEFIVEQQGGILGGRPVKYENFDSEGNVARVQAGFQKFASDPDIVAIVVGGTTPGEFGAARIISNELKIPYFTLDTSVDIANFLYTVSGSIATPSRVALTMEYVLSKLRPRTAAFLGDNNDEGKAGVVSAKKALEAAGVKTVSEQYFAIGTADLTPYLTKVKAEKPDMVFVYSGGAATYQAMYKQIVELGGWGDTKVVAPSNFTGLDGIRTLAGAEGAYFWATWLPGLSSAPASVAFEQAWQKAKGAAPQAIHAQLYNAIYPAVEAIKQAGSTDRAKIATLIRSGSFGFESPAGKITWGTDGLNNLRGVVLQIKGGKIVPAQ